MKICHKRALGTTVAILYRVTYPISQDLPTTTEMLPLSFILKKNVRCMQDALRFATQGILFDCMFVAITSCGLTRSDCLLNLNDYLVTKSFVFPIW